MKNLLILLIFTTQFIIAQTPCVGGLAGSYPCNGIDLLSNLPISSMGGSGIGNDSWGWTDPDTGIEYAIMCMSNGTAFIDISDPVNPKYLGILPTHTFSSSWRDVKTYNNHAFVVSEASGHGMQVFDLTRLRNVVSPPVTFTEDAHFSAVGNGDTHNIAINEDTGYAYVVGGGGSGGYSGGPIFINIQNPTNPILEGGYSSDGYTHDAQIVIYHGPDAEHVGKEILIASNEDTVTIVDVTDKSNPIQLSRTSYTSSSYTHQGWLTYDHAYYIFDDELDEQNIGFPTRTRVMDFSDLDNPTLVGHYNGATNAIDHNGYTKGNRYYMSNYRAGVRVLDITNVATANLTEVSYFDTYPSSNSASFDGAWNVYPYFKSGVLLVSDIDRGLFLVKDPNYDATPPTVICQDITVTLDATGTATITPLLIDGGSTDNGLIFDRIIDRSTFTCADIGPNEVQFTVLDSNENKSTCTAIVTVEAETTTYTGTWNNGIPDPGKKAIISSNYSTDSGSLEACACEIETGNTVTVTAGTYMDITTEIVVDGTLEVLHEGSLVQRDNNAAVINNGNISIHKTTPSLDTHDFMILGSPMTAEIREGVYGAGRTVRNHVTENFIPHPLVEIIAPGAANWADDNGDNWVIHTGIVNPGEGYLVRPQPTASDSGIYNLEYSLGTLNNGIVNFDVIYNGTQNASPNILANPYASAINAELFISENTMVNEVYFWEHIEAPDPGYPGYYATNYSMGDISVYNAGSGGVASANGGDTPSSIIASGQGFGIKATEAGTAIFNNSMRVTGPNDNYRTNEIERERLWLDIKNEEYGLGSNILIAFTEEASNDFEAEFDTQRMATPVSFYSVIGSGKELLIQGRSAFNEDQEVILGFSTQIEENQEYTISIREIEGEELVSSEVFLYDKQLNVITNLKESDYSFESNVGDFKQRFKLYFKENSVLELSDFLQDVYVYPIPSKNSIHVVSPEITVNSVQIFDLRGRMVEFVSMRDRGTYEVDISKLESAFYLLKISTNAGTIIKRIIKE